MSERSHHHNPAAHSRSRPTRAKRGGPSLTHKAISNCEPHDFNRLRYLGSGGPESREADGCPSFLEKRDRERSFFLENRSQYTQIAPSKDIVCVLLAQTKDATIVCVIGCSNNEERIPHTSWTLLLSARHDNKGKLYSYQNARFNRPVSEDEEQDDVYPPTGGVFYICIFGHESCWRRSPIATPRGRSSKFPWRGSI